MEILFQVRYPAQLGLLNFAGRDSGPQLDDLRQMLLLHRPLQGGRGDFGNLLLELGGLGFLLRQALIVHGVRPRDIFNLVFQGSVFRHQAIVLRQLLVFQAGAGAGLVHQVDGLIRQEPVVDVPLRQGDGAPDNFIAHLHPVEGLVIFAHPPKDLHRLLDGGLPHLHRLEAALQGGVLFDVLAVFGKGGGAN